MGDNRSDRDPPDQPDNRWPLAYMISFRCYGTWLHGDRRGSVDRAHNAYDSPMLEEDEEWQWRERARLKNGPFALTAERCVTVEKAIREVSAVRGWEVISLAVRTNHVHVVVAAPAAPERVMGDFKAYATRGLRRTGLAGEDERVWAEHGSTVYLWDERAVEGAYAYVEHGQ